MLLSEMKSVRGIIVLFGFTASPSAWPLCPISIMLVLTGLVYILYGENILAWREAYTSSLPLRLFTQWF